MADLTEEEEKAEAAARLLTGRIVVHHMPRGRWAAEKQGWFLCGWCGRRIDYQEFMADPSSCWSPMRKDHRWPGTADCCDLAGGG